MRIVLIQPPALQCRDSYSSLTQPPLGLAYLSSVAKSLGHQVQVLDAVGEALDRIHPWPHAPGFVIQGLSLDEVVERVPRDADVVGFSCMFTHAWPMVRELTRRVRRAAPGAFTIGGGEHCTAMYERVLKDGRMDLVVRGEGETTFREVLGKLESGVRDFRDQPGVCFLDGGGRTVANRRMDRIEDPDRLPYPDWDAFRIEAYMDARIFMAPSGRGSRSIPMLATRGCPFACTFCASPNMWTRLYRTRDPKKVVDEMESWHRKYGASDFHFQDLTMLTRKRWILDLCREIVGRKLPITWKVPVGTRSEAIDGEVTDWLVRSGCRYIVFAPESASEKVLEQMDKRIRLERLVSAVRAALASGMQVSLFMVAGIPLETKEDLRETFRFIRRMARLGVHEMCMSSFVPLPGTALFELVRQTQAVEVTDEFCYRMAGASRLFGIKSWNPLLSDSMLRRVKWSALAQFYLLSFLAHPGRVWGRIRAIITQDQDLKLDRILRDFFVQTKRRVLDLFTRQGRPAEAREAFSDLR